MIRAALVAALCVALGACSICPPEDRDWKGNCKFFDGIKL